MSIATLRGSGIIKNIIFDVNNPLNRDNCFEPYALLRQQFSAHGIELNTADVNTGKSVEFELHQDIHGAHQSDIQYLLQFETPAVKPGNNDPRLLATYRKVFTWNDDLIDGERFIKINFPNPLQIPAVDGFAQRERFCNLIAGNKAVSQRDSRELYSERVRAIRWFQKNFPEDFDLYGVDWDLPPAHGGVVGKVLKRLQRKIAPFYKFNSFPSYRGKVSNKKDVLLKTKFSICYENVKDLNGYITEKIFDCFFAGCVPVYWGAGNIADHIPPGCFIDRRNFESMQQLHTFLKNISESQYIQYQTNITDFLKSEKYTPFGSEFFAQTIVRNIVNSLNKSI